LEPITPPISPPPSFDSQLKNAGISLRNPRYPELLREPAGFARETDWRASLFSLAARFAVAAGVVALVALIFFLMVPASRQTDTASTSSEVTGSTKTDPPPSGQGDVASKPALDQFKALLATAPVSQPAPQEQSQPLLQGFIEWRQKDNPTQTTSPATIDSE
jgi:type IV secretory pathway VirB10-like protein